VESYHDRRTALTYLTQFKASTEPPGTPGEFPNLGTFLEEARELSRNLAYHRRARLEEELEVVLDEVDRQIEGLRADRRG
jgi:hypothetical protein